MRPSSARRGARAAVVVAALLVAPSRADAQTTRDPVAPSEVRALHAALVAAVDAQRLDAATFDRALGSADVALRRLAVLRAGQAGARDLAPRLRDALGAADSGVAANAAFALALLHDTSAVATLAARLGAPTPVGDAAAFALGEIGEPARAAILAALDARSAARTPAATAALLYAAGKLRPVPADRVVGYLGAPQPVRRAAAYAIGRTRVPAGLRRIIPLARDPDPDTRSYVARGLARGGAGDSLAAPALAALTRLAADRHPHVRIAALRSIATFGARSREVVRRALRDPDANVRVAAAEGTATALDSTSDPAWAAAWSADTAFGFRRALLAAAPGARLAEDRRRWAADARWTHRAAAVIGEGEPTFTLAATLRRDRDPRVRGAAFDALARRLDSASAPGWLRDTLVAALADSDAIVRAGVIGALAGKPRPAEVARIRAAYADAAGDRDNDARLAALRYLVAAWRADSGALPAPDREWLDALPAPADPLEREAARDLPAARRWRPPDPAVTAEPFLGVVDSLLLPALRGRLPHATLHTARGPIEVEFFADVAPLTVRNFLALAARGYYRGTRFHRVVGGFVAQDGDPRGDGSGGPGYAIRDENNRHGYRRGVVGMALSGPNTGGSQYFITLADQPHLDAHYTAFARVVGGMERADRVVVQDGIDSVTVRP